MRRVKQAASLVCRYAISALNRVLPKQDKAVLAGFPDMEDSIVEIARQLGERGDIAIVVLTEGRLAASARRLPDEASWCSKKSIRGLFHYLTAKYVFFTHGLYFNSRSPASQICVNVWHGMPIKRIGHMIGRTPPPSTFGIATSDIFRPLVARCFGVPDADILTTGIPRNDVMVRAASQTDAIKMKIGMVREGVSPRLIFWLPTFRQAVRGIIRTDGVAHSTIFGMDDMDTRAFSSFLEKRNCVCIVKTHPMSPEFAEETRSERVMVWKDHDLRTRGISLYEMVGASDLLITDASSVYVDYLILDKPVIIAFPDLDEYRRSRGFALEPVEDFFAGPVVSNYSELTEAIAQSLRADKYAADRARLAKSFHKHRDAGATARLLEAVLPDPR